MTVPTTAKEEILKIINFNIKKAEGQIESFERERKESGYLYAIEWRLEQLIKAEAEKKLLTQLKVVIEEKDVDIKEYITHIKEKYILENFTSGRFNKNSTNNEANLIALYTGEAYGKLYDVFGTFLKLINEEED